MTFQKCNFRVRLAGASGVTFNYVQLIHPDVKQILADNDLIPQLYHSSLFLRRWSKAGDLRVIYIAVVEEKDLCRVKENLKSLVLCSKKTL